MAERFGMGREDEQWILIGTSHLFLNGAMNLIEMPDDVTPIIDKTGKLKGSLRYAVNPIIFNKHGVPDTLSDYYSIDDCEGKDFAVQI